MVLFSLEWLENRRLFATTHLAVVGDFSSDDGPGPVQGVSNLVKSWSPSDVITVGDNNYPSGAASTIDSNIGQWYHQYISPYKGSYGAGTSDAQNHFWPSLGNHDWDTASAQAYLDYFTLPNNERYYATQIGNVGIFVVDSDSREPDGVTSNSTQANWIKNAMQTSTATWKLVFFHEPPYSSGGHGNNTNLQWDFKGWGATAVFAGHEHDYERLSEGGLTYFVDGLGGETISDFLTPISGSLVRYNGDYGAMKVDATDTSIQFQFITRTGQLIDTYTIDNTTNATDFIPANSTWKYLDNGSNQATAWESTAFDDSTWKSGTAQLGYGDGDETTVVGYGSDANNKYITTYFRKSFTVTNAGSFASLNLNLVRDDGAVVYLNGTEVYRNNMPTGTINYQTLASTTIGDADESAWYSANINPSLLLNGNNTIAVEIHQVNATSSDISFNLQLSATVGQTTPMTPAAPTGLAALTNSNSQITLNWQNNANNQTGFIVDRSTDGTNFTDLPGTLAASATSFIDTNLDAGKTYTYRMIATNAAGNSDFSNLASATTFPAGAIQTYLSNIVWASATVGYGTIHLDQSINGNPIKLKGTTYSKGIGTHAVSNIVYNLNGQYTNFISDVGIDDEENDAGDGSIDFKVIGDGKTLYDSGVLNPDVNIGHISISVAGVKSLTLTATNGVAGSIDYDHADWAGAYLLGSAPVLPSAPTNLLTSALSTSQIKLTWTDSANEQGFKIERSPNGTTFTQIGTTAAGVLTFTDGGLSAATTYTYRVRATNAAGDSDYSNTQLGTTLTQPVTALPAPWTDADIGTVGAAGSASASGGVFTVKGSGLDIWNSSDAFNFVYQPLTGNGTITARVVTTQNTQTYAKAGVMIRETLAANAREATTAVTPSGGIHFLHRAAAGAASDSSIVSGKAPLWVRMVRSGNTFTSSRSTNGTTWTTIGSITIAMGTNTFIGLAVSAKSATALNTSTFDNVSVSGGVQAQSAVAAQAAPSLFSTKKVTDDSLSTLV